MLYLPPASTQQLASKVEAILGNRRIRKQTLLALAFGAA